LKAAPTALKVESLAGMKVGPASDLKADANSSVTSWRWHTSEEEEEDTTRRTNRRKGVDPDMLQLFVRTRCCCSFVVGTSAAAALLLLPQDAGQDMQVSQSHSSGLIRGSSPPKPSSLSTRNFDEEEEEEEEEAQLGRDLPAKFQLVVYVKVLLQRRFVYFYRIAERANIIRYSGMNYFYVRQVYKTARG
jgi:hypothetical protein